LRTPLKGLGSAFTSMNLPDDASRFVQVPVSLLGICDRVLTAPARRLSPGVLFLAMVLPPIVGAWVRVGTRSGARAQPCSSTIGRASAQSYGVLRAIILRPHAARCAGRADVRDARTGTAPATSRARVRRR